MADGTITRKEIITDDALRWGAEYAKTLNEAIGKNKEFVDSIILLNTENVKLRRSENQTEFIKQKNEVKLISEKAISLIKEQHVAEINLEKVKQESLKTDKLALDVANKKQNAAKASIKLTAEERVQNELNNRVQKQEILAKLNLTEAYSKLNKQRTEAKNKYRELIITQGEEAKATKQAAKEFQVLDEKVRKADRAVGDFTKNVGNYPKLTSFANGIKNIFSAFGFVGGIAAAASVIKGAYKIVKEFEQGVADLSAITGATGKDLQFLKNQAIELGKGTKGGAVQVVEAYKLIASAKPELLENVEALNQVTEATILLAKASGLEIPEAASKLTDAMNQFGAPADEATKYVDVLAAASKYGASEIPQLTEAVLEFGSVAKISNIDIKESAALVELLAEKGIKGAQAGTAIRNILLEINSGFTTKEARTELDKYGISWEKLKDKTVPFSEKLELLKPLLSDTNSVVNTFKKENAAAAISLIDNTERLKELTKQVDEYGVAQKQADIRTDTLQGDTEKLSSTYDSLILSLNNGSGVVSGFFRFFVDGARGALEGLIKLNSSVEELGEKSRKKGNEYVLKVFNVDKSKEELEKNRDVISQELEKTSNKINELTKKFNERGFLATFNPFAKGTAAAKKEISDLYNTLGQYEGAYKKIQQKLNPKQETTSKKPASTLGTPLVETLEEKTAREKAAKEALEIAKKLSDSAFELKKQELERTIKINDEIAKNQEENDDLRLEALKVRSKAETDLVNLTKKHALDADKFVTAENKLNANQKLVIAKEAAFKIEDIEKKSKEERAKINEFDSKEYELELKRSTDFLTIGTQNALAEEEKRFQAELALGYANDKAKQDAAQEHEKKLFDIKKAGLIAQTRLQINTLNDELNAYEAQSDGSQKSQDYILAQRAKVAELTARLIQTEGETFKANENDKGQKAKITTEEILQISSDALGALSDLANAFSERKIQKIDDEIEKNNEFYDKQIELAGNDERQKDLFEKEREKKNDALEKKKREAKNKQAKIDKAVAIAQASIATALAILNALGTKPFLPLGPIMATLAGVLGAVQVATIIATPIPKYKDGRKGGKSEIAWVGDGGVSEVISGPKGIDPRVTPNVPTLTHLKQGDIVHKSMADYQDYMRASILSSFQMEGRRMNDFQAKQNQEKYGKESLAVMKETLSVLKKQKHGTVINLPKIDINHHLWKQRNTNWNN